MNILVINAGSSSLKYQLVDMSNQTARAKGLIERIGQETVHIYQVKDKKNIINKPIFNHAEAIKAMLSKLTDEEIGVVTSMRDIGAVGHRVVHGGSDFTDSVLIDEKVLGTIRENIELAPLHNPANITGIEACQDVMGDTPMVAVFDTAFHQTMPKRSFLYGLPYEAFIDFKIRRYGFHGTSHKYIANRTAELMGCGLASLKIISCHLGNGASVAAIKYGKSIDTSMGFTTLEGLVMGTRCGNIDPAIPEFLSHKLDKEISINDYLNKQSGVLGLSGVSNDFRDIWKLAEQGNERAKTALEVYTYQVKKHIGAYIAAMDGVDVIVFSAGIGENDEKARKMIMQDMAYIGAKIDEEANTNGHHDRIISTKDAKVSIAVVKTNEELMIAIETKKTINCRLNN